MTISIITATFNSETTIAHTLESIVAQRYQDIEVLIMDGGSCDNTLTIVEQYRPLLKERLRVVSEPDQGLYDAMNKGISQCHGDVVGILNSDDFYTSRDVLQKIAHSLSDRTIDAVYSDVDYVAQHDTSKVIRHYSSRLFRPWMMRLGFMPAHPSFYCRREIYLKYGLFDMQYKVAADFEQLLRLIYVHRIRTRYLPFRCVTMRVGGASSSGWQSHRRILSDHRRALRHHHIYTNLPLLGLRYLYKIGEVIISRLTHFCRCNSK